jgi:broad specificity phosphatase PhoE
MNIYLVRHGKAGDRTTWEGDDRMRPLTRAGRRQAEALAEMLRGTAFEHLVTSPYVRCIETLVPLACDRTHSIEVTEALAEGAALDAAFGLVRKYADHGAVLCTHGDIVPMILGHLESRGVATGPDPQWPKGSTWILECEAGEVVAARYVAPVPEQ